MRKNKIGTQLSAYTAQGQETPGVTLQDTRNARDQPRKRESHTERKEHDKSKRGKVKKNWKPSTSSEMGTQGFMGAYHLISKMAVQLMPN